MEQVYIIIFIMLQDIIHLPGCHCKICLLNRHTTIKNQQSDLQLPNDFHQFIKMLPSQFVLPFEQTVIVLKREGQANLYESYQNNMLDESKKWNINVNYLRTVTLMPTQNITVYSRKESTNLPKFKLNTIRNIKPEQILYIQCYQPRPSIRVSYKKDQQSCLDGLLRQHLKKEEQKFQGQIPKINQEFLQWVFVEYGQEIFFRFILEIFLLYYHLLTRSTVQQGVFYWVADPIIKQTRTVTKGPKAQYDQLQARGRPKKLNFKPKLVNVKGLKVNYFQKLFSFHEEYQSLVKQKIYQSPKKTISAVKNPAYRVRLQRFRQKLHSLYQTQQKNALSSIQQEKVFEYQQDSDEIARLLIPGLGPNRTLRQILNDQTAFEQVFPQKYKYRVKTQTMTKYHKTSKQKSNKSANSLLKIKSNIY